MSHANETVMKTVGLTAIALIAFAANSILCRMALGTEVIDAAGFTGIRLASGALMLVLILQLTQRQSLARRSPVAGSHEVKKDSRKPGKGSWFATFMLFIYAATFSFAYTTMDTGTGALILFGAVQLTMIAAALMRGHHLSVLEWAGVLLAFAGFVYLVLPGLNTPSLAGFVLMSVSGIAWGLYTLRGQGSVDPLGDTAYNFLRTVPLIGVLLIVMFGELTLSSQGVVLAVLSGAVASGLGYTIWYSVLKHLSATQAAVLQLSVPVIAALGGVVGVQESITMTLVVSGVMILGGILLVIAGRQRAA